MKRSLSSMALAAVFACGSASGHELLVGRNGQNQIVMQIIGGQPFDLEESQFPGFDGFAAADPGFVALGADRPAEDFFALPGTANLEFILTADEPHIQVWNDTGTAPMEVGESFTIGSPLFHVHPIWHSPDGASGEIYTLTIRLRDLSGQLADSPAYGIQFTPVPEPSTVALLSGGLWAVKRRRV